MSYYKELDGNEMLDAITSGTVYDLNDCAFDLEYKKGVTPSPVVDTEYTVTWKSADGTETYKTEKVKAGNFATAPGEFDHIGLRHTGWTTVQGDITAVSTFAVTQDTTFYAIDTALVYDGLYMQLIDAAGAVTNYTSEIDAMSALAATKTSDSIYLIYKDITMTSALSNVVSGDYTNSYYHIYGVTLNSTYGGKMISIATADGAFYYGHDVGGNRATITMNGKPSGEDDYEDVMMPDATGAYFMFDNIFFDLNSKMCDFRGGSLTLRNCHIKTLGSIAIQINSEKSVSVYLKNTVLESTYETANDSGVLYLTGQYRQTISIEDCEIIAPANPGVTLDNDTELNNYMKVVGTKITSPNKVAMSLKEATLALTLGEGTAFFPYSNAPVAANLTTTDITYIDSNGNEVEKLYDVRVADDAGTIGVMLSDDYAITITKGSNVIYVGDDSKAIISTAKSGCTIDVYKDVTINEVFGTGTWNINLYGATMNFVEITGRIFGRGSSTVTINGYTIDGKRGKIAVSAVPGATAELFSCKDNSIITHVYENIDIETNYKLCDFRGGSLTMTDCNLVVHYNMGLQLNSNSSVSCVLDNTTIRVPLAEDTESSISAIYFRGSGATTLVVKGGSKLFVEGGEDNAPIFVGNNNEGSSLTIEEGVKFHRVKAGSDLVVDLETSSSATVTGDEMHSAMIREIVGINNTTIPTFVDASGDVAVDAGWTLYFDEEGSAYYVLTSDYAVSRSVSGSVTRYSDDAKAAWVAFAKGSEGATYDIYKDVTFTNTGLGVRDGDIVKIHGVTFTNNVPAGIFINSLGSYKFEGITEGEVKATIISEAGYFIGDGNSGNDTVTFENLNVLTGVRFADQRCHNTFINCDIDFTYGAGAGYFNATTRRTTAVGPVLTLDGCTLKAGSTTPVILGGWNKTKIASHSKAVIKNGTTITSDNTVFTVNENDEYSETDYPMISIDADVVFDLADGVKVISSTHPYLVVAVREGFTLDSVTTLGVTPSEKLIVLGTENPAFPVFAETDVFAYSAAPSEYTLAVYDSEDAILAYYTIDRVPADVVEKFGSAKFTFAKDADFYFRNNKDVTFSASTVIDLGDNIVTLVSEGVHLNEGKEVQNANRFSAGTVDVEFKSGTLVLQNGTNLMFVEGTGTRTFTNVNIEAHDTAVIDNRGSEKIIFDGCVIDVYFIKSNIVTNNYQKANATANLEFVDTDINMHNEDPGTPSFVFGNSCRAGSEDDVYNTYASIVNATFTRCTLKLGCNYLLNIGDQAGETDMTTVVFGEGCSISTTAPSLAYSYSDRATGNTITLAQGTLIDTVAVGNGFEVILGEGGTLGLADASADGFKFVVTARPKYSMSTNLTLYTDIVLNLYFPVSNTTKVTVDGVDVVLAELEQTELPGRTGLYYVVNLPECNANDVHNSVSIEVAYTSGDNTFYASRDVSIVDYLTTALSVATEEDSLNLIANVVKYVASVYTFAGDEMPDDVAALLANNAVSNLTVSAPVEDDAADTENVFSAISGVRFNMSTALKIRFVLNAQYTGTLVINGVTYNVEAGQVDGNDYIEVNARAFKLYSSDFVVKGEGTVGGEAVTLNGAYNLVNYILGDKVDVEDGDALDALLSALYNYCKAAYENRPEANS